jgi:hypothetical protein
MIWEAALPGPREVGITQSYLKTTVGEYNQPAGSLTDVTSTDAPTKRFLEWLPRITEEDFRTLTIPKEPGVSGWIWERYGEIANKIIDLLQLGVTFDELQETMGIANRMDLRTVLLAIIDENLWGTHQVDPDVRWRHLNGCLLKGFKSTNSAPLIFSVCRESYEVVSKHCQRVFATRTSKAETYFDYQRDTLYLQRPHYRNYDLGFHFRRFNHLPTILSSICDSHNLRIVKNLAIAIDGVFLRHHMSRGLHALIAHLLDIFCGLKKLTLVLQESPASGVEYEVLTVDEISFGHMEAWQYWDYWEGNRTQPSASSLWTPLIAVGWLKIDMEALEKEKFAWGKQRPRPWDIPLIEYKLEMSPRMKEWMNMRHREIEVDAGQ